MMLPLRLLSLCAGIGAIDYVWSHILEQEIAGQVELDPFCLAVLVKQWPLVPKLTDIRKVHGDEFGPVDLVAGGIPCQPFSRAGKRTGTNDDRYLWPEMLRVVQYAQPAWVLVENVADFIPLVLDRVSADLETEGYQVRAFVLPACAVGAPHIRERAFLVAHADGDRRGQRAQQPQCQSERLCSSHPGSDGAQEPLADATSNGSWWSQCQRQPGALQPDGDDPSCARAVDVADTNGTGLAQWPTCNSNPGTRPCAPAERSGLENADRDGRERRQPHHPEGASSTVLPGSAPAGRLSQPRLGGSLDGLSDWLDGPRWPALPGKPQHAWEPPRTTQEKDPLRRRRVHALGNAIVPQQVYPLLRGIMALERGGQ